MKIKLRHDLRIALIASILCGASFSCAADLTYTGGSDENLQNASAGDRLVIDLTSRELRPTSTTITADVYVADFALTDFSGNSPLVYTFTGSLNDYKHFTNDEITPIANISLSGNGQGYTGDTATNSATSTDASNISPIHLIFNGEMGNFTGNIESVGSAMQVSFSSGSGDQAARRLSASGKGDIMIGGRSVDYNFGAGGDVTVNNGHIIVSNTIEGITSTAGGSSYALNPELSFTGGANYLVGSTITADKLRINSGTAANFSNSVTSTTSQTLSGTVNFSSTANLSGSTYITGSVTAKAGASLSLLGSTTIDGGRLTLNGGATLTIGGTFSTDSTISADYNGTLNFAPDVLIDLSRLTPTSNDTRPEYRLFSNTYSYSFIGLTAENICSPTAGYTVRFVKTGFIVLSFVGDTHNYTNTTTSLEDYFNGYGDIFNFSGTGNSLTLGTDVTPAAINIQEDSYLTVYTRDNILNAREINISGTLKLDARPNLGEYTKIRAQGGDSQLLLELIGSRNFSSQLEYYTGNVTILSGSLIFATAEDMAKMNSSANFTISNFARLELGSGNANAASINLQSGTTLILNGVTGFSNALSAAGNTTISVTDDSTLNQNISGSGTITRTGTGKLTITSNQSFGGTLDLRAGITQLGDAATSARSIAYNNIIVREGATFAFQNGATQFRTIQLDGGTLHNEEASNSVNTIEALRITKDSNITTNWSGTYNVAELSGNGNLSISESNERGETAPFALNISKLKNYTGRISGGSDSRLDLSISSIEQESGYNAIIEHVADGLNNTNLSVSGAGSVTFNTALNVSDTLSLSGAGSVYFNQNTTAQKITVEGSTLHYASKLSVGESISLSNGAKILASLHEISGNSKNATISRIDATQEAVLSQPEISNLALNDVSIITRESMSISNSTLTNSKIVVDNGKQFTLSDVELINSQVEAGVTSLGTQNLTTLGKTTESMLVLSMQGFSSSVSITGTLTLGIHLTESQFDEFVVQCSSGGMVAIELEGISSDLHDRIFYNNIMLNFYDENDQLYSGSSINAQGYTTTMGNNLALYIPEPSTATLSLLALAGLLAHRRRKMD